MSEFARRVFMWRDEPIHDIREWARKRGELMVQYEHHREGPSALTLRIEHEMTRGEMPESFWNGMIAARSGPNGLEWYVETGRVTP